MSRFDPKGRQYVRVPWLALENLPNLVFELSQIVDPGEDGFLFWDDSEGEFTFRSVSSFGGIFHGYVDDSVAAEDLPPTWTVARPNTGEFVITHNLNLNAVTDLRVTATLIEAQDTGVRATIVDLTADTFTVFVDDDAADANRSFFFIAVLKEQTA